jgi:hypothetical protein
MAFFNLLKKRVLGIAFSINGLSLNIGEQKIHRNAWQQSKLRN